MSDDREFLFSADEVSPRQRALFDQVEEYLFRTARDLFERRGRFWNRDFSSPEAYERSVAPNREHFLDSLGGWPWERGPLEARKETVQEFAAFRMERVTYRLFDTVETDSLLLTPRGDGPFPAILCQVGVNGPPERILGFDGDLPDGGIYKRIGARLAAHGYVVLGTRMITGFAPQRTRDLDHRAPHLMTPQFAEIRNELLERHGKDVAKYWDVATRARTYINRLCRIIGRDIFGMETFSLSRGIDLLEKLPQVRPDRIGIYGLSQGGMMALDLGALEPRLTVSVSSASFNERLTKQVFGSEGFRPFLVTCSESKIYPRLHEFDDSDVASLICPRCFFVEAGRHDDSVDWRQSEVAFDRVKAVYERLGIPERCERKLHEGGHEVEEADDVADIAFVRFMDRWLKE